MQICLFSYFCRTQTIKSHCCWLQQQLIDQQLCARAYKRRGKEREMLSVNLDRVARSLCSAPADPVVAAAVTAIAAAVNLIDKDMWHTHVNYAFISCADSFTHTQRKHARTGTDRARGIFCYR